MGRPKGSLSKIPKIQYPRKCEHCEYVSNNPQMFHYHKQTHEQIPANTYCQFNCGNKALFKNTHGKYTCVKRWCDCPAYIKQLSERTEKSWRNADDRKETFRQNFSNNNPMKNAKTVTKLKNTLKKKSQIFTPEQAKEYRHYARYIRSRAQKWAREQGYVLGKQTYHVDHKFSILDAWHANLAEPVVNHPANLQILEANKNSSKGPNSSITLEELMSAITPSDGQE